jgi:UPF0755 protein
MRKSKKGIVKKVFIVFVLCICFAGYFIYKNAFKNNVRLNGKKFTYLYIKSNSTYEDVLSEIYSQDIIEDKVSFEWTAREMDLEENIHCGKFRIDDKMSNRSIINAIKKNKQERIKLYFNSQIRSKEEFINYVTDKLELSKDKVEDFCNNDQKLDEVFHLNSENMMCLVVPKIHEISWATTFEEFEKILKKSYDSLWTDEKRTRAKIIGFTIPEIIIIASITQSESNIKSEQQKIAGVYINRLKKGMRLQADPTVVFANQNFDVQRVLSIDKEIDSPYNTYKYKGLPPGPICLVQASSIDAVLYYTKHAYTFFCAKPDFSGYSNFTNNYLIHQKNAKVYQKALNEKGINR